MTTAQAIADLDFALSEAGEPCVLRRPGFIGMTPDPVDVTVMARVRTYKPSQIVGAILQGDSNAVPSPTGVLAAGWPGALVGVRPCWPLCWPPRGCRRGFSRTGRPIFWPAPPCLWRVSF